MSLFFAPRSNFCAITQWEMPGMQAKVCKKIEQIPKGSGEWIPGRAADSSINCWRYQLCWSKKKVKSYFLLPGLIRLYSSFLFTGGAWLVFFGGISIKQFTAQQKNHHFTMIQMSISPGGRGILGILGWGCATGTLEPLAYLVQWYWNIFGTENSNRIELYHFQNTGKFFASSRHEAWH